MTSLHWQTTQAPNGPSLSCPNCGTKIARRPVLRAAAPRGGSFVLLACDACTARFFEDLPVGDYGNDPPGGGAALAFYLQQGANMGGMAVRLAALGRPPGTRYLEIGCGFGIGLDVARRALGWDVLGLDPSPFAAVGRDLLSLPIEPRYLLPDDPLTEQFDVVYASEVLEHVAEPLALLNTLHRALRPGGTLVLTTPAAECITPGTSEGLLVPLLSAGWHVVLQTAESLAMLLRRAGFVTLRVWREGAQLVAIVGAPPRGIEGDRRPYLTWLRAASAAVPAGSDLGLGLGARLYRECASAGDTTGAASAWAVLDAAVTARFGRGLESLAHDGAPCAPTLEELVLREPVCMGGILLHRGLDALQRGEPAEALLSSAATAALRLRTALRAIGSDDGDAEEVGFAAEKALIILAALRGEAGIAERITALVATGGQRHAVLAARGCFVPLVNGGALNEARRIDAALGRDWHNIDDAAPISQADASIAYCRAVLELQTPDGRWDAARDGLRALRDALLRGFAAGQKSPATVLYWPATEAEALALRLTGDDTQAEALRDSAQAAVAEIAGFPCRPLS
ncbi:class I SAM-dependent methyltransferase [Humitalea sp. 24SJ18S-53]|uniref:class I SAM-dependent methyltransferase n=1 Tax=Humitalea sp. 24SJ18S-53 TaxID=3422307 RepID=UPI003D667208